MNYLPMGGQLVGHAVSPSGRNGRRSLGLLLLGEEADGTGSRTGRHWNPFTQSSQMPASLLSSLAFELQ